MEVVYFFLGQAAIILWLAAPLLLVVLLGWMAVFGAGLLIQATSQRNLGRAFGGIMALAVTAALGWMGYVFFKGAPGKLPRAEVAQPSPRWSGPLPSVFVSGGSWDEGPPMELVRSSGVKRVLRAGRRKTYRESMRQAPEEYKTLWEELQVKPDAKCQTALERGLTGETSLECIDVVPVVLPAGRPEEPYWAEQDLRNDLADAETINFYVVNGASTQLVLSCEAKWPRARHPLTGILTWGEKSVILNAMRDCRRAAFHGKLIDALVR